MLLLLHIGYIMLAETYRTVQEVCEYVSFDSTRTMLTAVFSVSLA